jgi:hypothetical protein
MHERMNSGFSAREVHVRAQKPQAKLKGEEKMNQDMPSAPAPMPLPEEPKKNNNNTWLIVAIVLVVLCCCCLIAGGLLWQYGDQILKALGQG